MVDKNDTDGSYDFAPQQPEPKREEPQQPEPPRRRKTEEPRPAEAPAKPEPMLAERACPHCGYKIYGKPAKGRCPECAAPLDELTTGKLQFSDGGWLRELSNGALLIAVQIAGHVLAVVLTQMGRTVEGGVLQVAAASVGVVGVWMATRQEPGLGVARLPLASAARWVAIGAAAVWVVSMIRGGAPAEGKDVLAIVLLLVMSVLAFVTSLHLRMLAARVPNDSLVAQFLNLAVIIPVACVTLVVLQILGLANVKNMGEKFLCGFGMIGALGVVALWSLITMLRMSVELRNCASAGEAIAARKAMKAKAQEQKTRAEREKH